MFEDFVDDDGIDRETSLKIAVSMTVAGDTLEIDLSGSSPQAQGPVNCTRNMSELRCLLRHPHGNRQ